MSIDEDAQVEPAAPDVGPVARLKHPRAIRWLHWINFPLLAVMIWSGLRIYWAEDVYAFGFGSWQWFAFFPDVVYEKLDLDRHLARGMAFHFSFAWLFVINGLAYAVYLAASGEWRHIVPDRRSIPEAKDVVLHDLHLKSGGAAAGPLQRRPADLVHDRAGDGPDRRDQRLRDLQADAAVPAAPAVRWLPGRPPDPLLDDDRDPGCSSSSISSR